ncbi:hypothetical protein CXB40_24455 [Pseudomonas syringae pv. avii]|nr:hypothetical protein AL046_27820 [Pseudomonas syringae pv. avii]POQ01196.1 hypothetical protein CXB40_24455 [Pseudomonas syringae pv. avii]
MNLLPECEKLLKMSILLRLSHASVMAPKMPGVQQYADTKKCFAHPQALMTEWSPVKPVARTVVTSGLLHLQSRSLVLSIICRQPWIRALTVLSSSEFMLLHK